MEAYRLALKRVDQGKVNIEGYLHNGKGYRIRAFVKMSVVIWLIIQPAVCTKANGIECVQMKIHTCKTPFPVP